jgi:hypothetical protein
MTKKTLLLAGLALIWCATGALAAPVTFFGVDLNTGDVVPPGGNAATARSNFLSNLSNVGSENFSGFAVGTTTPMTLSFPGSSGNLSANLTSSGDVVAVSNTPVVGLFATSAANFLDAGFGSTLSIDFSATPISAFGFYGTDIADSGGDLVVQLTKSGGGTDTFTILQNNSDNNNNVVFWGFFDTSATYTALVLSNTSSSDRFGFDDMVIGDQEQVVPNATPLPAALPMFMAGACLFGLIARRRKQKRAA